MKRFHHIRQIRDNTDGVVSIEFALIASFLLLLALGTIDFGDAWVERMKVDNAARAGAQLALVQHVSLDPVAEGETALVAATEIKTAIIDVTGMSDEEVAVTVICRCTDGTTVTGGSGNSCEDTDVLDSCGDPEYQTFVKVNVEREHKMMLNYPGLGKTMTFKSSNEVRLN